MQAVKEEEHTNSTRPTGAVEKKETQQYPTCFAQVEDTKRENAKCRNNDGDATPDN